MKIAYVVRIVVMYTFNKIYFRWTSSHGWKSAMNLGQFIFWSFYPTVCGKVFLEFTY